jgi:hypothetical protein
LQGREREESHTTADPLQRSYAKMWTDRRKRSTQC